MYGALREAKVEVSEEGGDERLDGVKEEEVLETSVLLAIGRGGDAFLEDTPGEEAGVDTENGEKK